MTEKTHQHLYRAIEISLFTDDRVDNEKGWWGNSVNFFKFGTRLWKFERDKLTQDTITKIKKETENAIAWLKEKGIIYTVDLKQENDKLVLTITLNDEKIIYEL